MAENFATFEYKTLEEVLTVIRYLTNILSTTGMQLLEIVSPSHLLTHLHSKQNVPLDTMVATVQVHLKLLFAWILSGHVIFRSMTTLRTKILKL